VAAVVDGGGGARVAVIDVDASWSYATLDDAAERVAQCFAERGLKGARVAVRAPTSRGLIALHVGAARAGVTLVPLNLRHGAAEHDAACVDAACAAVFDDVDVRAAAAHARPSDARTTTIAADVGPILFTSGTSGRPKGARLTLAHVLASAQIASAVVDAAPDDVWLLCLPLFHVGGIAMMWRALSWGATLRLMPVVDVDAIARLAATGAVQHASVVPTTLRAWLSSTALAPAPRMKAILVGGGPVSRDLLEAGRRAGLPVVWTWGMTETTSQACTASPRDPPIDAAAPLPGVVVDVRDAAGHSVDVDVVGDVFVKGPTLFAGYLGGPVALCDRGFFATGDLGSVDAAGRLRIAARRTDLILSGGENLYPAEIEAVLARCPDVVDVAVVGVPDDVWGQRPVAIVARAQGAEVGVDVDAVAAFARAALPKIKRPDRIVAVDILPRLGNGKVDRAALLRLALTTG
jgi:O-succinylbenzoic acid--CoA ligase